MTLADKLEAHFRANEGRWIDGMTLARYGGGYSWRTRVSQLRRERGMDITNDQPIVKRRDGTKFKRSVYRYVGPQGEQAQA